MEINQYPLIATVINDEDWYDVDFWNGAGWQTRKIAGSTLKTILGENIYNSDGTIDGIRRITLTNSGDKIIVKGGVNENLFQVSSDDVSGYEFSTDDELVKWSVVRGTDNAFYIRRHNPSTGALVQVPFYINTDGSIGFAGYVFPLTDGGANQALMTDGAGTLFFGEPTAISAKREIVPFINKTGAPVTEGTIVYLKTTSSSGTYPEIVLADASTEVGSSKTIGAIYETTANDAVGYIVTSGEVDNLDTSMYSIGDRLWLSTTAGQVTTTPPSAPDHAVFIGTVTRAQNGNGRILYAIQNGYELQELHNVSIPTTPSNGNVLTYNSTTNLWEAQTPAGGSSGKFGIADSTGTYTFYSTLQAAITAASSGQVVEMFTDVTETSAVTVNLKNGVNINGNGHTYTLNNTGTSSCLSDNGVAITCSIDLNVRRIGATTPSGTNTTCALITGASKIDFTGSKLYGSNSVSLIINNSGANISNVYAYGDTGANAPLTVYVAAGKLENSVVYNNANNPAYYVYGLQNLGTIINCTVYATSGYYAIYNQGEMIDCIGYNTANAPYGGGIKNESTAIGCTGYASGGTGFYAYVNTLNKNCNGYSSGSVGFTVNGSVNCKLINCTAFSAASYAFYAYNAFVQNCTGWSTANYAIYASNAGDGFGSISNGTFTSDASATIFSNMSTNSTISNNTIVSRYNAATGHSIVLAATAFGGAPLVDVLNNTLIVANPSANCIYSASAYTIKYASNVFKNATTAVNANITQGISNSADTKGNILI